MPNQLLQLLEQERVAIINADFTKIDALAEQKTALFERTVLRVKSKESLAEIQRSLRRNEALLLAAIEGVSAARVRLNAIREVRENLRVYDKTGHISQMKSRTSDLSKRS